MTGGYAEGPRDRYILGMESKAMKGQLYPSITRSQEQQDPGSSPFLNPSPISLPISLSEGSVTLIPTNKYLQIIHDVTQK